MVDHLVVLEEDDLLEGHMPLVDQQMHQQQQQMTPTSLKADQLQGEGGSVVDSRRLDCLHMAHVASGCGRGC